MWSRCLPSASGPVSKRDPSMQCDSCKMSDYQHIHTFRGAKPGKAVHKSLAYPDANSKMKVSCVPRMDHELMKPRKDSIFLFIKAFASELD